MKKDIAKKLIDSTKIKIEYTTLSEPKIQGHDNTTYIINDQYSIKLPSAKEYENQILFENKYLNLVQKQISFRIPKQIYMGEPNNDFPYHWSINEWIKGITAEEKSDLNSSEFTKSLANCLLEFNFVKLPEAFPISGNINFHRGGDLNLYANEFQNAMKKIEEQKLYSTTDINKLKKIFTASLNSSFKFNHSLVHGDINPTNIILESTSSKVEAIIDFGQTCIGDPSCDYAIAWICLSPEDRVNFFRILDLSTDTISRSIGWALWKASITIANDKDPILKKQSIRVFKNILEDKKIT